ncbi:MAG TPA: PTS sugar transporter subunit IIC [Anaeromyxobacteraceae bacterium]|nr:PTS sugar transporter subunit IIC [Anaeromyxobacteraceae bacterium]
MSSYLALAVVAGLAGVERKGVLQAMLSRPIALGTIVGLALGDVTGGLLVAVPLELLWLGAVNLGAALPVHEALGAAAVAGGAVLAGEALGTGVTMPVAALAVVTSAPLAVLGRTAERAIERANERLVDRAEVLVATDPAAAARANVRGLALPFLLPAVLAPAGAAVTALVVPALLRAAPSLATPLSIAWVAFAVIAAAAGAFSVRAARAGKVFFAAATAAAVVGAAVLAGVSR